LKSIGAALADMPQIMEGTYEEKKYHNFFVQKRKERILNEVKWNQFLFYFMLLFFKDISEVYMWNISFPKKKKVIYTILPHILIVLVNPSKKKSL